MIVVVFPREKAPPKKPPTNEPIAIKKKYFLLSKGNVYAYPILSYLFNYF